MVARARWPVRVCLFCLSCLACPAVWSAGLCVQLRSALHSDGKLLHALAPPRSLLPPKPPTPSSKPSSEVLGFLCVGIWAVRVFPGLKQVRGS